MLKASEITASSGAKVIFDIYVPIQILTLEKSSTPLRWSYLAPDGSLLDLAFNDETGELQEITLVAIAQDRLFPIEHLILPPGIPEKSGIPACDTIQWPSDNGMDFTNHVRETQPLSLFIGNSSAIITIGESKVFTEVARLDRISLFFGDDKSITAIRIDDISPSEFSALDMAVGRT